MLQRVMPGLMGMKDIWVLNDEGHHCYRHKPGESAEEDLKGDDRKEAEKNNEAARVWISGLAIVKRKLGVRQALDRGCLVSTSSTTTRCGRIGHWRSTLRRDASRCSGCRASESTASRC